MARKQTRIQLKRDIEANWEKATGFIPLRGEVVIYESDETHIKPRLKVGDGETNINNLPFIETNGSSSDECKLTVIKTTDNSIVEFKNTKPIDRTFSIITTLQGVPVYHYSNRIPHKTMQNSVN